jgi:hypothetical protein
LPAIRAVPFACGEATATDNVKPSNVTIIEIVAARKCDRGNKLTEERGRLWTAVESLFERRIARKRPPTEVASIQVTTEFLDDLPQVSRVLLNDPARFL